MFDPRNPPEELVQLTVADWLDRHGIQWCHVPNEGRHKAQYRRKQARLGLKAGVPDVLIFDPPPARPDAVGTAIELKRRIGGTVSKAQQEWLDALRARGWVAEVCQGVNEALGFLETMGYGRRSGAA